VKEVDVKLYKGNAEVSEPWSYQGFVGHCDGVAWLLFSRPGQKGWTMLKLVADGKAPTKANYWLGWDGRRFARSKDHALLQENRPQLRKALLAFLGGD